MAPANSLACVQGLHRSFWYMLGWILGTSRRRRGNIWAQACSGHVTAKGPCDISGKGQTASGWASLLCNASQLCHSVLFHCRFSRRLNPKPKTVACGIVESQPEVHLNLSAGFGHGQWSAFQYFSLARSDRRFLGMCSSIVRKKNNSADSTSVDRTVKFCQNPGLRTCFML